MSEEKTEAFYDKSSTYSGEAIKDFCDISVENYKSTLMEKLEEEKKEPKMWLDQDGLNKEIAQYYLGKIIAYDKVIKIINPDYKPKDKG